MLSPEGDMKHMYKGHDGTDKSEQ